MCKQNIAESFNKYFSNIGQNLASTIPNSVKHYESYLDFNNSILSEQNLTDKELEDAFCSLKSNKSAGYDDISANVVKNAYQFIQKPLKYIFNLSFEYGEFPNTLKIIFFFFFFFFFLYIRKNKNYKLTLIK